PGICQSSNGENVAGTRGPEAIPVAVTRVRKDCCVNGVLVVGRVEQTAFEVIRAEWIAARAFENKQTMIGDEMKLRGPNAARAARVGVLPNSHRLRGFQPAEGGGFPHANSVALGCREIVVSVKEFAVGIGAGVKRILKFTRGGLAQTNEQADSQREESEGY